MNLYFVYIQIAEVMARLCAARAEDEGRGGGAADARRWTALRTPVEARAMLKTVFRAAADNAAQVVGISTTLAGTSLTPWHSRTAAISMLQISLTAPDFST
jgi:hypothetical protein